MIAAISTREMATTWRCPGRRHDCWPLGGWESVILLPSSLPRTRTRGKHAAASGWDNLHRCQARYHFRLKNPHMYTNTKQGAAATVTVASAFLALGAAATDAALRHLNMSGVSAGSWRRRRQWGLWQLARYWKLFFSLDFQSGPDARERVAARVLPSHRRIPALKISKSAS